MTGKNFLSAYVIFTLTMAVWSYRDYDPDSVPVVFKPPPLSSDFISPSCWNFTHGNRNTMEFYSPNYPGNYSGGADCIQYLEAPKGYKIHLDFKNNFILEESADCNYDYLEIRDGPFGYSPLLKRHCGRDFPPFYLSSSRYLWLRFKTDDNVHKKGFHATYSYQKDESSKFSKDPRKAVCRIFINAKTRDGIISEEDIPTSVMSIIKRSRTKVPIDCTWEIRVPPDSHVQLSPVSIELTRSGECDLNYMSFYMPTTILEALSAKYCDGRKVVPISSDRNRIFLRIFSKTIYLMPKFKFLYTVFRNGLNIPHYAIILGAIGLVLLLIIFISVCYTLKRKKREQKKEMELLKKHAKQLEATAAAAIANSAATSSPARSTMSHSPGLRINNASPNSYVSLPRRNEEHEFCNDPANRSSFTSTLPPPFIDNEHLTTEKLMETAYFKKYFPSDSCHDEDISPCSTLTSGQPATVFIEKHQPPPSSPNRDVSSYWKPQPTTKLEQTVPPFYSSVSKTIPYKASLSPNTVLKDPLSAKPLPIFNSSDIEFDNEIGPM
eukprot:XP_014779094.1 PREDICTED: neuropilin and tolloid-like protein 1 [Octopus bimaculoides]